MPARALLVTPTGEPYQPVRLTYAVPSIARAKERVAALACVGPDAREGTLRVWLAGELEGRLGAADPGEAVGVLRFPSEGTMTLDARSHERAKVIASLLHGALGDEARLVRGRVVNRLFAAGEGEPDALDGALDGEVAPDEGGDVPSLEDFPLSPAHDAHDLRELRMTLDFRFLRALRRWRGEDVTLRQVIAESVTSLHAEAARAGSRRVGIGVADHAGWAVLVTVGPDARVIDRRRVALLAPGLPCLPHHHEAQALPRREGVALIARVRESAYAHAREALEALARALRVDVATVALRRLPALPPTVEERIEDYRAQCVADGVMFREAIAAAALARGWSVEWYETKTVLAAAARALGRDDVEALLAAPRQTLGPPWQKDHRVAMAAAIAAAAGG